MGDVIIIILKSICPAAQLSCASLVSIKPMIKQSVTCICLWSPCDLSCGMRLIRFLIYWFVTRSLNETIFYCSLSVASWAGPLIVWCFSFVNPIPPPLALEWGLMEICSAMNLQHVHGHGTCNLSDSTCLCLFMVSFQYRDTGCIGTDDIKTVIS